MSNIGPRRLNNRRSDGKILKPRRRSWGNWAYIPRYPTFTNTYQAENPEIFVISGSNSSDVAQLEDIIPMYSDNISTRGASNNGGNFEMEMLESNIGADNGAMVQSQVSRGNSSTTDSILVARRQPTNYTYASSLPRPIKKDSSSESSRGQSSRGSSSVEEVTRNLIHSLKLFQRRQLARLHRQMSDQDDDYEIATNHTRSDVTFINPNMPVGTGFDSVRIIYRDIYRSPGVSDFAQWTKYEQHQIDRLILLGDDATFWSNPPSPVLPIPDVMTPAPDYEAQFPELTDTIRDTPDSSSTPQELVYNHEMGGVVTEYLHSTNNGNVTVRSVKVYKSLENGVIRRTRRVRNIPMGYVPSGDN